MIKSLSTKRYGTATALLRMQKRIAADLDERVTTDDGTCAANRELTVEVPSDAAQKRNFAKVNVSPG